MLVVAIALVVVGEEAVAEVDNSSNSNSNSHPDQHRPFVGANQQEEEAEAVLVRHHPPETDPIQVSHISVDGVCPHLHTHRATMSYLRSKFYFNSRIHKSVIVLYAHITNNLTSLPQHVIP